MFIKSFILSTLILDDYLLPMIRPSFHSFISGLAFRSSLDRSFFLGLLSSELKHLWLISQNSITHDLSKFNFYCKLYCPRSEEKKRFFIFCRRISDRQLFYSVKWHRMELKRPINLICIYFFPLCCKRWAYAGWKTSCFVLTMRQGKYSKTHVPFLAKREREREKKWWANKKTTQWRHSIVKLIKAMGSSLILIKCRFHRIFDDHLREKVAKFIRSICFGKWSIASLVYWRILNTS